MEIGGLYQFVLMLVLIGVVIGTGVLILDKMAAASGVTGTAATAINSTRAEVSGIATTWLPIVVIVSIAALLILLISRSFFTGARK